MDYEDFGLELVQDDRLPTAVGEMDYASLGEMDYVSLGDDEYDEFGAIKMSKPSRYRPRGRSHLQRPPSAMRGQAQVVQKTILAGRVRVDGPGPIVAGAASITIRPQFDFVAEDITFNTSPSGQWTILSIEFGDRIVFSNAVGVPQAVFATASFVRGLIKGAAIAAGLDIQISANLANATTEGGELNATLVGLKRGTSGCGPGAV